MDRSKCDLMIQVLRRAANMTLADISMILNYSGHNPSRDINTFLTSEKISQETLETRVKLLKKTYKRLIKVKVHGLVLKYLELELGYSNAYQTVTLNDYFSKASWDPDSVAFDRLSETRVTWSKLGICTADENDVHVCPICATPEKNLSAMRQHICSEHGPSEGGAKASAIVVAFMTRFESLQKPAPTQIAKPAATLTRGSDDSPFKDLKSFKVVAETKGQYYKSSANVLRVGFEIESTARGVGKASRLDELVRDESVRETLLIPPFGQLIWRSKVTGALSNVEKTNYESVWVDVLPKAFNGATPLTAYSVWDFADAKKLHDNITAAVKASNKALSAHKRAHGRLLPANIFVNDDLNVIVLTDVFTLVRAPSTFDEKDRCHADVWADLRNICARLFIQQAAALLPRLGNPSKEVDAIELEYKQWYPESTRVPSFDDETLVHGILLAAELKFDDFHVDLSAAFETTPSGGATPQVWLLRPTAPDLHALIELQRCIGALDTRLGRGGSAAVHSIGDGHFVLRVDTATVASNHTTPNAGPTWPRHISLLTEVFSAADKTPVAAPPKSLCFPVVGCWAWREKNDHSVLSLTVPGNSSETHDQVWIEVMENLNRQQKDECAPTRLLPDVISQLTTFEEADKVHKATKKSVRRLNALGFAHGDLKPLNVFIRRLKGAAPDGTPKESFEAVLIDWTSLCKHVPASSSSSSSSSSFSSSSSSDSSSAETIAETIPLMSTRGYFQRDSLTGTQRDEYALSVMKAQLFAAVAQTTLSQAEVTEEAKQEIEAEYGERNPNSRPLFTNALHSDAAVIRAAIMSLRGPVRHWNDGNGKSAALPCYDEAIETGLIHGLTQDHDLVTKALAELEEVAEWTALPADEPEFTACDRLAHYDLKLAATAKSLLQALRGRFTPSDGGKQQKTPSELKQELRSFRNEALKTVAEHEIAAHHALSALRDPGKPCANSVDLYLRHVIASRAQPDAIFLSTSSSVSGVSNPASSVLRDFVFSFVHAVSSALALLPVQRDSIAAQLLQEMTAIGISDNTAINPQKMMLNRVDVINRSSCHELTLIDSDRSKYFQAFDRKVNTIVAFVSPDTAITRFGQVISVDQEDSVATVLDTVPAPGDAGFVVDDADASLLLCSLSVPPRQICLKDVIFMWQVTQTDHVVDVATDWVRINANAAEHYASSDYVWPNRVPEAGVPQKLAHLHARCGWLDSFTTAKPISAETLAACVSALAGSKRLAFVKAQVLTGGVTAATLERLVHTCAALTGCDHVEFSCEQFAKAVDEGPPKDGTEAGIFRPLQHAQAFVCELFTEALAHIDICTDPICADCKASCKQAWILAASFEAFGGRTVTSQSEAIDAILNSDPKVLSEAMQILQDELTLLTQKQHDLEAKHNEHLQTLRGLDDPRLYKERLRAAENMAPIDKELVDTRRFIASFPNTLDAWKDSRLRTKLKVKLLSFVYERAIELLHTVPVPETFTRLSNLPSSNAPDEVPLYLVSVIDVFSGTTATGFVVKRNRRLFTAEHAAAKDATGKFKMLVIRSLEVNANRLYCAVRAVFPDDHSAAVEDIVSFPLNKFCEDIFNVFALTFQVGVKEAFSNWKKQQTLKYSSRLGVGFPANSFDAYAVHHTFDFDTNAFLGDSVDGMSGSPWLRLEQPPTAWMHQRNVNGTPEQTKLEGTNNQFMNEAAEAVRNWFD